MSDVLTELLASKIPIGARAFVLALCKGEGGNDTQAWWREYGGTLYAGLLSATFNSANPLWPGRQGPSGISHALGAGQFQPATYEETAARTGLTDIEPQSQLANIWNLMQYVYNREAVGREIETDLAAGKQMDVAQALKSTWESLSLPRFATRYAAAQAQLASVTPPAPVPPAPIPPPPSPIPPLPPPPTPTQDPEVEAIEQIVTILSGLGWAAQKRVADYLTSRFG